jgi:hypothetical protein
MRRKINPFGVWSEEMTLFDDEDLVAYLSALPVKGWD